LNGDRRKKYNKWLKYRNTRTAIYPTTGHEWAASFHSPTNEDIRKALLGSLQQIVERCNEWKVYVSITEAVKVIKFFDFESWIKESEDIRGQTTR
jgi:acyl transferase domain-containing protein